MFRGSKRWTVDTIISMLGALKYIRRRTEELELRIDALEKELEFHRMWFQTADTDEEEGL